MRSNNPPPHDDEQSSAGPRASSDLRNEGRTAPGGAPRWVKVSLGIAVIVVLLVLAVLLIGGSGGHGPQRHLGDGGATPTAAPEQSGGHTGPPPGVTHDAQQP
jgi:hypothetical protein